MIANDHRRRASMYVMVLMTSMVVAAIGISSLALARIRFRTSEGNREIIQTRLMAQAAVEIALLEIGTNPNWRTTYTDNTWTAQRAIGDGLYLFKFVDKDNGSLSVDPTAAVRVFGEGVYGGASRVYSVLTKDGGTPVNVIDNGNIENGTTSWYSEGAGVVSASPATPHTGLASLLVAGRAANGTGAQQDVTGRIENGQVYLVELWMKSVVATTSTVSATLAGGGPPTTISFDGPIVGPAWTLVTGSLNLTWTGTLAWATIKVSTTAGTNDFYIDDVILIEDIGGEPTPIALVPGEWRWETGP